MNRVSTKLNVEVVGAHPDPPATANVVSCGKSGRRTLVPTTYRLAGAHQELGSVETKAKARSDE